MNDTDPSRRGVLRWLGAGAAVGIAGVGTTAAVGGPRKGASAENTIVEIAVNSPDFNVLVAAVTEAGLAGTLSGDEQFTVFAPTDAAFNALGITENNVDQLDDDFLLNVLLYHVTEGRRYAASVVNAPEVEMLNGDTVSVDGRTLDDGQAKIIGTNIEASNGVIHVIDGVLLP